MQILDKKMKSKSEKDKIVDEIKKKEAALKSKISANFTQLIIGLKEMQDKMYK